MTQAQHGQRWWHPLNKKLASTRPVVWIISKSLHHLDRVTFRISDGQVYSGEYYDGTADCDADDYWGKEWEAAFGAVGWISGWRKADVCGFKLGTADESKLVL